MATFIPLEIKIFPSAQKNRGLMHRNNERASVLVVVCADNGRQTGMARQRSAGRVTRTGRGKKERGGELTLKQHNKETPLRRRRRLHFMVLNNSPS